MSFIHMPLTEHISMSRKIQEDLLLSFVEVDEIDAALTRLKTSERNLQADAGFFFERVSNIAAVFNENMQYITEQLNNFKPVDFPDYDAHKATKGYVRLPLDESRDRSEYEHQKTIWGFGEMKRHEEILQLQQLLLVCAHLKDRLATVTKHLSNPVVCGNCGAPDHSNQMPKFTPIQLRDVPSIRRLVDAPLRSFVRKHPSMKPPAALVEKTTSPSKPVPSTVINLTVKSNVGEGNVLGYCCDPHWAGQPIAFTSSENGWIGQVPVGKEGKFVVIQNGKVLKWEEGNNRTFNAENPSIALTDKQVRFA